MTFLQNTVNGDLGYSLLYRGPVSEVLADRLWPTLLLVGTSTVLAALIGVWMGIRSGWERGGRFDKFSTGSSLTLYSMPEWWLGLVLIAVFAVGPGPAARPVPDRRPALGRRGPVARSRACSTRSGTSRCR